MPESPFSTRLSGDAKETELRLRSIFKWKKKRPPIILIILLAFVLLVICGSLVCFRTVPDELIPKIEQWIEEYTWSEESDLVNEETQWVVENIKRTNRRHELEGVRGEIYEIKCSSESGMLQLSVDLLVDPAELNILDLGGWMIEGKEEASVASPEPDMTKVAPIRGTALSPDGKYEVRLIGAIKGVSTDEQDAAERVQICNTQTDAVLWEGPGAYEHSAVWSPNGKKLALARTTRTGSTVTIVETEQWSAWEVTLPGKDYRNPVPIPEYTYLPDNGDWFEWINSGEFRLTLGRGGDAGDRKDYYGGFYSVDPLNGYTMNMEVEDVYSEYDLNHDGLPERLEKQTIRESEDGPVSSFVLYAFGENESRIWSGNAGTVHAAWNTYFACTLDGKDYLLQCNPVMYGGDCGYSYRLFCLGPDGEEVTVRENEVGFDVNPASKFMWHNFDADAIADFVDELNELLAGSKLLLTTDDAYRNLDPEAPREDLRWLFEPGHAYDETKPMRENLEALEDYLASI